VATADSVRQIDVRYDALVQQQRINRHALRAAGPGVRHGLDLVGAFGAQGFNARDHTHLGAHRAHQAQPLGEIGRGEKRRNMR
jgi:hypothetical protein